MTWPLPLHPTNTTSRSFREPVLMAIWCELRANEIEARVRVRDAENEEWAELRAVYAGAPKPPALPTLRLVPPGDNTPSSEAITVVSSNRVAA